MTAILLLKLMSGEDLPDSDSAKNYQLIPIGPKDRVSFTNEENFATNSQESRKFVKVHIDAEGSRESHELAGNAYLMNLDGKTIASRSAHHGVKVSKVY